MTTTAYDLALIIPTDGEFADIRGCIPFKPLPVDDDGDYWFEFPIPGGRTGVARVLFDMGLTETAATASRMLQRFDPEVLVVLGIGGALDHELRLGDVVVGDTIQEYLKSAKAVPGADGHTLFRPAGTARPLPERLRRFVTTFPYFHEQEFRQWTTSARGRILDGEVPVFTTPGGRSEPRVLLQPIASGDVVVTDDAFREWLLSIDRKRGVIEMEAAGASSAVNGYDRDIALLVLRGISDFADSRKAALDGAGGVWRRYAVQNAAELLMTYAGSPGFPWRRTRQRQPEEWMELTRPDSGGRGALSTAQAAASRAWDYFTRVAHVIEIAGVVGGAYTAYQQTHHGPADSAATNQDPTPDHPDGNGATPPDHPGPLS